MSGRPKRIDFMVQRPHDRFDKRLHILVLLLNIAVMGATAPDLDPVAGTKASRRPLCVYIATGSRRSKTQKLFPFGHFGIPFL